MVAAEGVAPGQPVQQDGWLVGQERPDLAHLLLVGHQHAVWVQHALGRPRRARREEDLGDVLATQGRAPPVHLCGGVGTEVGQRHGFGQVAVPAENGASLPDGVNGLRERGVFGDHEPRVGKVRHGLQLGMVLALQGVGNAHGNDRCPDRHGGQRDHQMQAGVAGQHHHRTIGNAAVENPLGDAINQRAHLAPARLHPRTGSVAFGDEHPARVFLAVPSELVHDADRVLGQPLG